MKKEITGGIGLVIACTGSSLMNDNTTVGYTIFMVGAAMNIIALFFLTKTPYNNGK